MNGPEDSPRRLVGDGCNRRSRPATEEHQGPDVRNQARAAGRIEARDREHNSISICVSRHAGDL